MKLTKTGAKFDPPTDGLNEKCKFSPYIILRFCVTDHEVLFIASLAGRRGNHQKLGAFISLIYVLQSQQAFQKMGLTGRDLVSDNIQVERCRQPPHNLVP